MRSYKELIEEYKRKKTEIKKRLKEFKGLGKAKDERLFSELCFCILAPHS
ncbi:MAG: DNA lyase, partial [Candidatus Omnitrophica bacterium]|nr:DNA lyase [Candidatus Omnitrophota bacterium]